MILGWRQLPPRHQGGLILHMSNNVHKRMSRVPPLLCGTRYFVLDTILPRPQWRRHPGVERWKAASYESHEGRGRQMKERSPWGREHENHAQSRGLSRSHCLSEPSTGPVERSVDAIEDRTHHPQQPPLLHVEGESFRRFMWLTGSSRHLAIQEDRFRRRPDF